MKKYGYFVLFTLFLTLLSFGAYAQPLWSSPTNTTPTNYIPNYLSEFNITWSNDVNMTFITITNSTGYVLVNNISMSNLTYEGDIYNFSVTLPAGTFNWTSYANDSSNNWNFSDTWNFAIGQADNPVYLYFNNGTNFMNQNTTITYGTQINATGIPAIGTAYIFRNGLNVTSENSQNVILGANITGHEYKVNATGNTNYSDNSTGLIFYAFVNKGTPTVTLYTNGGGYNRVVNLNETINLTAVSSASVLNVNLSLNTVTGYGDNFQNGTTPQTNLTNTSVLGTGIFNFSAKAIGNDNYSDSSLGTLYFYVANFSASPASSINYTQNANYNFSIMLPVNSSNVIFEANFNGTSDKYVNYTNSTNITNWNKTIIMYNNTNGGYWINFTDLSAGTYYYRWIVNDTNFSTEQKTYVINQRAITPAIACDSCSSVGGYWVASPSSTVTLTCSVVGSYPSLLTISGWSCTNSSSSSGLSINCRFTTSSLDNSNGYIYNCIASGNYSGSVTGNLTWGAFQSGSNNPGTTPTQNTTGSFTITSSSSSITVEPNSSKILTFTLSNKFSYDIININLSVSGIDSSWYNLDKTSILRLRHDSGVNTTQLTLNIPSDAERKTYSIVFTASGKDFNLNKITRQTTLSLIVPAKVNQTNLTEETNETTNETTEETASNETNITTGSASENNGFLNLLTGLSIKPEDFKNVVLFVGLIAVGLIFLFRSNITEFLTSSAGHRVQKGETKEEKKTSKISSLKNKLSKYSGTKLVIHVKKEEKEKV